MRDDAAGRPRSVVETTTSTELFHVKHRAELNMAAGLPSEGREHALALLNADAELTARLDAYVQLLARWRKITNLISETTFQNVWTRHILDSGQLVAYAPTALRWVDMGSGAGFPGLVIAMQLASRKGAEVNCIESDQRKCAFLREVARQTATPAKIHPLRIEAINPKSIAAVDAVTARALAPLPRLIEFAKEWIENGAAAIFPRGRTADEQLEALPDAWTYRMETFPSKLDPTSHIVRIRGVE